MKSGERFEIARTSDIPLWLRSFVDSVDNSKLMQIGNNANLTISALSNMVGGDVRGLKFELLVMILPHGSDSEELANLLRVKRNDYLNRNPGLLDKSGTKGVIAFDGRFIPDSRACLLSGKEMLEESVGSTCSHVNGHVPGYGGDAHRRRSVDEDRSDAWDYQIFTRKK